MNSALLFIGGFFAGMVFTLICGWYLSHKIEDQENRKL